MSHQALSAFIKTLQLPDAKYFRLALSREISNHLFLKSTLGMSSGELTEDDMTIILGRFQIVLETLQQSAAQPSPPTTARLPAGPEAYAPKKRNSALVTEVETAMRNQ